MNTSELAAAVAYSTGLSTAAASEAVKTTFEIIATQLTAGEQINVAGFGSFESRVRSARTGLNPQTREPIDIPAAKVPAFRAAAGLKRRIRDDD
ncbi:MAG: HU family DNA-binding protein [Arachnia sp.]